MMKKHSMLSWLLAFCICFAMVVPVLAVDIPGDVEQAVPRTTQSYVVSITPVVQGKSNWCWAACATMVGKHANPSSNKTQYDVVYILYNSDLPNVLGTYQDIIDGATYVETNGILPGQVVNGSVQQELYSDNNAFPFVWLQSYFKNDHPVIGIFDNSDSVYKHAMVLYGTQFIDGASGSQQKVNFIDPEDGRRYSYQYADLFNGTYHGLIYSDSII